MLNRHIALVSETPAIDFAELAAVAGALQSRSSGISDRSGGSRRS